MNTLTTILHTQFIFNAIFLFYFLLLFIILKMSKFEEKYRIHDLVVIYVSEASKLIKKASKN